MEPQSSELVRQASFSPGLRVLVDARKICDGGIGVYTNNLICGLLDRDTRVSVLGDPAKISEMPWSSDVLCLPEYARPYSLDELFGLARRVDFTQYDIFHTPHYVLPFGIPIPSIVTIHDLIHIHFPEKVYYPWIASALLRSALKRASRVLTVSQATFQDLHRFVSGRHDLMQKISVVPNALDPYFLDHEPSGDFVRSRFGITGHYFLAVSSMLKPHKGVRDLFEAFAAFQRRRVAED
ncbi:MAG: glycosyltransferase, partial [Bdellovibrionales bacterium]|nr:glycosyltransferase [Bdellovibrionales bacterium]